jgi:thioredoxin reductase (NADPH)
MNIYDIVIVGAGPAGLTAAIYARRANKKVLVLEANTYGGQIINTNIIENYPVTPGISGFDFATKLYNQTKDLGAEIKFEKAVDITEKEVITTKETYKTKTIILATGADSRKLKLENEEKLTGKGISYCATCDGAFYKNKIVAVNGGGNTALEDALYLSDIAQTVYLIHRRDTFKAEEVLIEKLKEKQNIKTIMNTKITKINGENKLENIEITNENNETSTLAIDALFIAVGQVPETENFKKLININEKGYVIATENCKTNIPNIFVAGDNRTKSLRQLVTATSDGAIAATEAIKYINDNKK